MRAEAHFKAELVQRDPNATVVPVIVALDKTQVTLFRSKSVYPVYLTIGNIPKDIRRKPSRHSQLLVAYLPTTRLEHVTNQAARRRMVNNLLHGCLRYVFRGLSRAGSEGVDMTSGNGRKYHCYPILAALVLDNQEQVALTCTSSRECPTCQCPNQELGAGMDTKHAIRDLRVSFAVLELARTHPSSFLGACVKHHVKPVQEPFWAYLPYANIYRAITADVLHQLFQGIIKYLVSWITICVGIDEVDARCRCIPPNHTIRVFHKGLSILQRVTGTEHDQMSRFILGLLVGVRLPNNLSSTRLVRLTRALLDFTFIAQYPIHTGETLTLLKDALYRVHENKDIIIDLGVRENFDFIKFHWMKHYVDCIEWLGSTDNYNTQFSERLHIDLAKDAYAASNRKDELPQMTTWLERKEKVFTLQNSIKQHEQEQPSSGRWRAPDIASDLKFKMAKHPTHKSVRFATLATRYGAVRFYDALTQYTISLKFPGTRRVGLQIAANQLLISDHRASVFHKVKFFSDVDESEATQDAIIVRPEQNDKLGRPIPARFDTALIRIGGGDRIQGKD